MSETSDMPTKNEPESQKPEPSEDDQSKHQIIKNAGINQDNVAAIFESRLGTLSIDNEWIIGGYMSLGIFAENADIPLHVLSKYWAMDEQEVTRQIKILSDASLVNYRPDEQTVGLNGLLRNHLMRLIQSPKEMHGHLIGTLGDPLELKDEFCLRWYGYHLKEAGMENKLKELLINYRWVQNKLDATSVNDVLKDYEGFKDERELKLIGEAIQLSAHILNEDKNQLASQLKERLICFGEDIIQRFLEQVKDER